MAGHVLPARVSPPSPGLRPVTFPFPGSPGSGMAMRTTGAAALPPPLRPSASGSPACPPRAVRHFRGRFCPAARVAVVAAVVFVQWDASHHFR